MLRPTRHALMYRGIAMTITPGRIDVHHHIIPPAFTEAMQRKGIHEVAGAPLPIWRPEDSLAIMDQCGTQTAITSLSAPGVFFGSVPEACTLARQCNEFSAEMVQRNPGRFGSFAVLPMPFTEHACKEAVYALDTLKADGIVLLGSTEGKFLGDPSFEELMAELDRRKTVVFVHPNMHATSTTIGLSAPGFLLEFLPDTTRAALNLITSGTLENYPNIRWILAHAGGFLPYIAWRLSLANFMPEIVDKAPQGMMHYIKRFYFDTALSPSSYAMLPLKELVGAQQVLFGSDFPFAPAMASQLQVDTLDASPVWDETEKLQLMRGNATSLFPQYKTDNDKIMVLPSYSKETLGQRLQRSLRSPVISLAERMRKR